MSELDFSAGRGRLIPWSEVRERTGLSRTTVWRMQKTGAFPSPLALSPGRVGWLEVEVTAWTRARLEHEPMEADQFERRPGGRPPTWSSGGRPSGRRAPRAVAVAQTSTKPPETPVVASSSTSAEGEPAPPSRRRRRAAAEAPGQLTFDF